MRVYSFNDFKYICYVEGKEGAVKKLFSGLASQKVLNKYVKEYDISDIYIIYKAVILNKKSWGYRLYNFFDYHFDYHFKRKFR